MSQIEILKNFILKENLIKDLTDIDFLFPSYEYDSSESLDKLINNAIEWGFNNDELEIFYSEHWDELLHTDCLSLIQGCKLKDPPYVTTFDLYRYNSKNMYYYKVESWGINEGMFDTSDCYAILDNKDDDRVIEYFKNSCIEVYTCNGTLDSEQLEGTKLEFWN